MVDHQRRTRWLMLAIAFLAQNSAFGINFGFYGTMVPSIQAEFGATRALAAAGISMMTLAMGIVSPFAGKWIWRIGLRPMMLTGAALCAIGYGLLALVDSFGLLLAIYAGLIGPGVCLLGVIPASALATQWFPDSRGRALGFVNMPLFTCLSPPVVASIVSAYGMTVSFLAVACYFVALIPLLATIAERRSEPSPASSASGAAELPSGLTTSQIIVNPAFILLALIIGVLTMAGVGIMTHLVPLALDRGLPLSSAALLLSAFGIAAAFGAIVFGWLADRIRGRPSLVVLALGSIAPWAMLLAPRVDLTWMLAASALIGFFSGGLNPLLTATVGEWFGLRNFGPALGLCYFFKIPFMFGAAPIDGFLRDQTGDYQSMLLMHIASFVAVGVLLLLCRRSDRSDKQIE